jgi:hypothetical protein
MSIEFGFSEKQDYRRRKMKEKCDRPGRRWMFPDRKVLQTSALIREAFSEFFREGPAYRWGSSPRKFVFSTTFRLIGKRHVN